MMQQSSSPASGTATPRTSGTPRGAPDLWAGLWHVLPAAACCLSWTFISSSAIFVNKSILVDLEFPYPVTVAWLGLLTTTLTSAAVVGHVVPEAQRVYLSRRAFMTRAMPTGFCMALTFQCGNLSYLYLTVSFIQMLKAFCPVITMLLLFVARLERPTPQLVLAVTIISAGVAVASYGEMHMSVFGLTAMLTSVVAESARLVLTQHLVCASHQLHPLEGLMYIGGACTFWLTIQAGFWELGPILRTHALHKVVLHPLHFLVAALAGLGVNALAILTIKLTSSLTLKVLGTVKDAVLVTVGVVFMHEQVSNLQLYGYCCSVLGFCLYNWIKATVQPEKKTRPSLLPVRETMKAA